MPDTGRDISLIDQGGNRSRAHSAESWHGGNFAHFLLKTLLKDRSDFTYRITNVMYGLARTDTSERVIDRHELVGPKSSCVSLHLTTMPPDICSARALSDRRDTRQIAGHSHHYQSIRIIFLLFTYSVDMLAPGAPVRQPILRCAVRQR